jgi:hypothetical protein
MTDLILGTDYCGQTEKIYDYYEINSQSPMSKGMRRYRVAVVNRNDKLAEFRQDMGPAKKFKGQRQIHIPSLWEHTFAELCFLGQQILNEDPQDTVDILELAGILNSKVDRVKLG